ncbi:MAG: cardiolipin synthase, partial [Lysobacteraceae bacterium]
HRSFRLNFELSMMISDRDRVAALAGLLQGEFDRATRVHDQAGRSLWLHRLPEAFARLASPLL